MLVEQAPGRVQQGHALGGLRGHVGQPHRLLELLARRRHGDHRLQRHRGHRRHQRQLEGLLTGGATQADDRLVDETDDLPHVVLAIALVRQRPVAQRAPGTLGQLQRLGWVGADGDLVQHPRDVVVERLKFRLPARLHVVLVPGGVGVVLRAPPIHGLSRHPGHLQTRVMAAASHGHGEHHPILDPGELAVADKHPAVPQEDAEQRRLLSGDGSGTGHAQQDNETRQRTHG